ncbi:hypothetical protein J21TS7_00930 [Paenibacillus cineris]|uniref:Secreted protein n=1 Tax=Paenibacillus cineris TaxID=237530 RepID=A0ABQ4L5K8_9BACL|nr:hypothetical protein J21TS7_00930 [Paenibacillus cineris]GIO63415.1 hypothetical protein J43TS9_49890 [Paenibacillus cineris]
MSDTALVFRTGFYRTVIPLGCCTLCYSQTQSEADFPYDGHLQGEYATMGPDLGRRGDRNAAGTGGSAGRCHEESLIQNIG